MIDHKPIHDEELKKKEQKPIFHNSSMIIDSPSDYLKFNINWEFVDYSSEYFIASMLLQRMIGDYQREEFHNEFTGEATTF